MTTTKRELLTADDLLRLHSQGVKGELIMGVLCEMVSTSIEHGQIVINVGGELRAFIRPARLGRIVGSDSGIWLQRDPDIVREPDVAFISAERLPLGERINRYTDVVPELVVEVVSPSDTLRAVHDKAHMWLNHGTRLVWVVDPDRRTIYVHQPDAPVVTLTDQDTLDGGIVLPGFTLPVSVVFE